MATVEISVGDKVFTCVASWTVGKAEKKIRGEFLINGGGLKQDGVAMDDEDTFESGGTFSFVGGVSSGEFLWLISSSCSTLHAFVSLLCFSFPSIHL